MTVCSGFECRIGDAKILREFNARNWRQTDSYHGHMMYGMIQVMHQFTIIGGRQRNGYALVTCGLKLQWFVRLTESALHKNHLQEHKVPVRLQAAIPLSQIVVDLAIKVA